MKLEVHDVAPKGRLVEPCRITVDQQTDAEVK